MTDKITEKQQRVIGYILDKIEHEGLKESDKLDTEIAIAKALSLTRATVREATRILIEQRKIYRIRGSGLFIGSRVDARLSGRFHALSPFDYQAQKGGFRPGRKVLSASVIVVPSVEMAQALRIKTGDSVYKILRLMSFDDIPVALESVHFPVALFSTVEFSALEISKYAWVEKVTGKRVSKREQNFHAFNVQDKATIEQMNIHAGDAMMELSEVVYLEDGTPFEVNIAVVNTRLLHLTQVSVRDD